MEMVSKAVALKYEEEKDNAPEVVAKGEGLVADKIVSIARNLGIPVVENNEAVSLLEGVKVGSEIPEELYLIVAEIFSFIHRLSADRVKMTLGG